MPPLQSQQPCDQGWHCTITSGIVNCHHKQTCVRQLSWNKILTHTLTDQGLPIQPICNSMSTICLDFLPFLPGHPPVVPCQMPIGEVSASCLGCFADKGWQRATQWSKQLIPTCNQTTICHSDVDSNKCRVTTCLSFPLLCCHFHVGNFKQCNERFNLFFHNTCSFLTICEHSKLKNKIQLMLSNLEKQCNNQAGYVRTAGKR